MLMAFDKVIPLLHAIIRGFEVRIERQSSEREIEIERESSVRLLAHSTRRSYIAHTHNYNHKHPLTSTQNKNIGQTVMQLMR